MKIVFFFLQQRFIDSLEENKIENMFLSLLENNKNQLNIKGLTQCLLRNIACLKVWNLNLVNYVPETILIFNYLCKFNYLLLISKIFIFYFLVDHKEFGRLTKDPLFKEFVTNIDLLKYPPLKCIKVRENRKTVKMNAPFVTVEFLTVKQ